jgi:hypothetical protein
MSHRLLMDATNYTEMDLMLPLNKFHIFLTALNSRRDICSKVGYRGVIVVVVSWLEQCYFGLGSVLVPGFFPEGAVLGGSLWHSWLPGFVFRPVLC